MVRGQNAELPFVVSLSNHERPFDRLRANGKRELRLIRRRVSLLSLDSRIKAKGVRLANNLTPRASSFERMEGECTE